MWRTLREGDNAVPVAGFGRKGQRMAEKVELRLTGRQRDETGEENVTELLTEAQLFRRNGSIVILYEETQEGVGTKNTLKLKGDVLELVKAGSVRTRMTFQEGKEYLSDYATPYGCLQMGIRTDALSYDAIWHEVTAQCFV